tara:strand:- start:23768 stop:25459 length:1692 start_codon:yes stop_codon:yes gene_type:complete
VTKGITPDEALAIAKKWLINDPDEITKFETQNLISEAGNQIIHRFGSCLLFGTAGIRGPRGAGPMRMNRLMVRVVATAIAKKLSADIQNNEAPLVVVGYDARHQSQVFAEDSARVLASHGIKCLILSKPLPTPVLAYTLLSKRAKAGIMVTASHNPAEDSGYKVYWEDGAQITTPIDSQIAEKIDYRNPPPDEDLVDLDDSLITKGENSLVEQYIDFACSCVSPDTQREISIVYTPLHGVGKETFFQVFEKAGFQNTTVVANQADPDPDFPTVSFPNPEEEGTLDLAIELADTKNADLVIANDPDADRLAVIVSHGKEWRHLNGNEIGVLLAEHLLNKEKEGDRLVVTTVVSSRLLSKLADFHKVKYAETLTGFKWIVRPGLKDTTSRFVFGYEEALGFAIGDSVRDKDGITAALLFSELAAGLKSDGKTAIDLLEDLWRRHGVHKTSLLTQRFATETNISSDFMAPLRSNPPKQIAGIEIINSVDLMTPVKEFPATDAIVFDLENGRVVIRPSGTEPMVKIYVEAIESVIKDDVGSAERSAEHMIENLLDGVRSLFPIESDE